MKTYQILLLIIGLCYSTSGFSEQKKYCDDLHRLACAPGHNDDGTGASLSNTEIKALESKIFKDFSTKADAEIKKLLADKKNAYFISMAIPAFGLDANPKCKMSNKQDKKACFMALSDGLKDLLEKSMLNISRSQNTRGYDLDDISWIINHHSYVTLSSKVRKTLNINALFLSQRKKARENVFPKVQAQIIALLDRMEIEPKEKKRLKEKIGAIDMSKSDCETDGSLDGDSVPLLMESDAYYLPLKDRINICSGMFLKSTSEFQMVFTIAHELAHSIDPCNVSKGPDGFAFKYPDLMDLPDKDNLYPIKNLISCLRDKDSIGAKNFEYTRLLDDIKALSNNGEHPTYISGSPYNPNGRQQDYTFMSANGPDNIEIKINPAGEGLEQASPSSNIAKDALKNDLLKLDHCSEDQIGESFSDWVFAEIAPKYMKANHNLTEDQYIFGYSNVMKSLCSSTSRTSEPYMYSDNNVHPDISLRINNLLLQNPKIRKQMGCPAKGKHKYCEGKVTSAGPEANTRSIFTEINGGVK